MSQLAWEAPEQLAALQRQGLRRLGKERAWRSNGSPEKLQGQSLGLTSPSTPCFLSRLKKAGSFGAKYERQLRTRKAKQKLGCSDCEVERTDV